MLQQTHTNWHLYIRDDGSTDNTLKIIRDFAISDSRITVIKDHKKNLGPALNFKELFNYTTSDFVICCDQDDIWFEKKLELLLNHAEKSFECDAPSIVYSDGYGYNSEKGIITIKSISTLHADQLKNFLFFNAGYQGCSIMMNKKLAEMFKSYPNKLYMHDNIISMIAHTFGSVSFLPKKLMLYRQHNKNVTGNISKSNLYTKTFKSKQPVISKAHLIEKQTFYTFYKSRMSIENKALFEAYFKFSEKDTSLLQRMNILLKHKFQLGQHKYRLFFKVFIRPIIK